ncbi:Protein of unknown function [Variovorax sp. CF079]|uniref:DUF2867 domain-containing protein n=1 Tax=Variovorax sp. CF079 TaxID=1882774 RepID=UPI00088D9453|nr:DUF2867 domain-containing protein [Variovorax sp. CF079]SDD21216.1 Protein of unknown function [Variovorax sp. CF079]
MHDEDWSVACVALPGESRVARAYATTDLADAYAVRLPNDAITDPELLARFLFSQQAPWIAGLMRIRDALVAGFGLKTSGQLKGPSAGSRNDKRISIFKIYEKGTHEILLGEDDKHLDFRVSVLHQTRTVATESAPYLVVSTVVHCHNLLGRTYIRLIAPFHRLVVQSIMRRAARAGWPALSRTE